MNNNTELTIVSQIKEVETKSNVLFEIDVTKVANLAQRSEKITDVNHPEFKAIRKEMQQTRKYVNDYFMSARREFNRLADFVREVEKTVLAEFTPEENRLISIEKEEKARLLLEARKEALPLKRERITTAGIVFSDEEILAMDDAGFELEFAMRLQAKLELDRQAEQERITKENAKIEAEKIELQRQKDEADRIEQARKEERERAEHALRLQKEQAEREKREAEAKKAEDEEKEQVRIADQKFQNFLKINKYNEKTDIIMGTKLYRLVAEHK
jgi:hypothetical protein